MNLWRTFKGFVRHFWRVFEEELKGPLKNMWRTFKGRLKDFKWFFQDLWKICDCPLEGLWRTFVKRRGLMASIVFWFVSNSVSKRVLRLHQKLVVFLVRGILFLLGFLLYLRGCVRNETHLKSQTWRWTRFLEKRCHKMSRSKIWNSQHNSPLLGGKQWEIMI